jgi:peptide/nickel transport system permease protein
VLKYSIKRILLMIPILLGVIIIVYSISYFMPGDPVQTVLGATGYTQEQYDMTAHRLGLDVGLPMQIFNYLKNLVTKGELGVSYYTGRSVMEEVVQRAPISIGIGILSSLVLIVISVPIGIISAVKQNSVLDYCISVLAIVLASVPGFWLALEFILLFSLKLRWLPASGLSTWKHYILPVACNSLGSIAMLARMTRSSMLEVIRADYVRTAKAKGVKYEVVITRHALKNALIPIITVIGAQFSMIIGGSVIIENIFSIPGMGSRLVAAISNRDYTMLVGITVVLSTFTMLMVLLTDLMYAFVDPRIKAEFESLNGRRRPVIKPPAPGGPNVAVSGAVTDGVTSGHVSGAGIGKGGAKP